MATVCKPIYLLADSQLLFWQENNAYVLDAIKVTLGTDKPKAAYIGASNGDNPDFYAIFEAALYNVGIRNCRLIRADLPREDADFLRRADLILLAGGDVERGWRAFVEHGFTEMLVKRYNEGAQLIGLSAGAIQLGRVGWTEALTAPDDFFPTLGLVPYIVSAHEEATNWAQLRQVVQAWHRRAPGHGVQGIGIPSGCGVIYDPTSKAGVHRQPLHPIRCRPDQIAFFSGSSVDQSLDP